jgi:hypothetical protein
LILKFKRLYKKLILIWKRVDHYKIMIVLVICKVTLNLRINSKIISLRILRKNLRRRKIRKGNIEILRY